MAIMTRETLRQIVKDELSAGIVNIELDDSIIERNIDRALFLSSDYFTYTNYKTVEITPTSSFGGYIELSQIDDTGNQVPSIVDVFPVTGTTSMEGAVLGIGSFYVKGLGLQLDSYLRNYATMVNKLSLIDSILGRGARVIGDKLYVDKYYGSVTVEYVPNVLKIENIHEGSWIMWIIDYTVALSKKQIAQARGKFVVDSNPFSTNAAELLEQANTDIIKLEETLQTKGVLLTSR